MFDDQSAGSGSGTDQGAGESINYVKEAAKLEYNWIALVGAAAFAVVSASVVPLVLAAGLELIYLSTVPHNPRFQRLVRSWKFAEQKEQQQTDLGKLFRELPPALRARYTTLESLCNAIRANYSRLSSTSQMFVSQMEARLQGLLASYLRLLTASQQYRASLSSTDPDQIRKEVAGLQKNLESDPPKVQDINRKRIEILSKRLEKFDKMRENVRVVDAQCAAIEDVLQLIRDQSVTLRDPQQLNDQLTSLVHDVEQTEETVQQVEAIFEMATPEFGQSIAASADPDATTPTSRNKLRS